MADNMRQQGKIGDGGIDHLSNVDVKRRDSKLRQAYVVQVTTERQNRNKKYVNEKSNRMVATKFKTDFEEAMAYIMNNRPVANLPHTGTDRLVFDEYHKLIERMGFLFNNDPVVKPQHNEAADEKQLPKFNPMQEAWKNLVFVSKHEHSEDTKSKYSFIDTVKVQSIFNFFAYIVGVDSLLVKPMP